MLPVLEGREEVEVEVGLFRGLLVEEEAGGLVEPDGTPVDDPPTGRELAALI